MKTLKVLSLIMLALLFVSNGMLANENTNKVQVEVIVFHGVKQCQTCQAIKKNSREVVESLFKEPGKGKAVTFKIIDFSKPENKQIAKKYEIAWTSLLLVKHTPDGKEIVNNLSKFAIENARTNTEVFRKRLAEEITKLLN